MYRCLGGGIGRVNEISRQRCARTGIDDGTAACGDHGSNRIFGHQHRAAGVDGKSAIRSEEHTSELQSLMRISYAVFCLKKKKQATTMISTIFNSNHNLHYNMRK